MRSKIEADKRCESLRAIIKGLEGELIRLSNERKAMNDRFRAKMREIGMKRDVVVEELNLLREAHPYYYPTTAAIVPAQRHRGVINEKG